MDEIFLVNSSSFQQMEISASLRAGPGIIVDFSKASQVTGTFVGEGSNLTSISASYIISNSNTTASRAISSSWANNANSSSNALSSSYVNPGAMLWVVSGSNGVSPAFLAPYDYSVDNVYRPTPIKEGYTHWDHKWNDWAVYDDSGARTHLGREVVFAVHNPTNVTLPRLAAVYISGSSPSLNTTWSATYKPDVYLAMADGTGTKTNVVGIVRQAIPSGSDGYVLQTGTLHNSDVSSFGVVGTQLWLSPTIPGGLTSTKPGQPNEVVSIGYVIESGSAGSLLVQTRTEPAPANAYAGMTSFPMITDNTSSFQLYIQSGSVNLYKNASGEGAITQYPVAPATFSLVANSQASYIYVSSNNVTASYGITTNYSLIDNISTVLVATVYRADVDAHVMELDKAGLALANKLQNRFIDTEKFTRVDGLSLYETGSRNFIVTAGSVWYGATKLTSSLFDSRETQSVSLPTGYDETHYAYHSASTWVIPVVTDGTYNNLYYDNGINLVPLTNNSWSVNYVFRILGDNTIDDDVFYLTSNQQYKDLASAKLDTIPSSIPGVLNDVSILVGRIIFQSGSNTGTVESAFTTNFGQSLITEHNSLGGLQGGGNGYWHLSQPDYIGTGTGVVVRQTDAILNQATITATGSLKGTASYSNDSTFSISSSFASRSISSSNSITASWVPNLYPQTEQISASWASASFTATSASFASRSISSSYAPFIQVEQISASWASASLTSTSSSFASRSISSSYSITSSFAASSNATTLTTASTYQITSSWANSSIAAITSVSSSFASRSISASWAPFTQVEQISSSWSSQSFWATSASFASRSISASWAPPIASDYSLSSSWATSSIFSISSSWASASLSQSVTSIVGGGIYYPLMSTASSGYTGQFVDTVDLIYNQNTNTLFATNLSSSAYLGPVRTGLNVRQFGATGDGTTDDTVAIQRAISASWTSGVSNRGVDLFFPSGVYKTTAPISCSGNNVFLVGAGVGGTALYPQHTTGDVLQFGSSTTGVSYVGLLNMSLICPTTRSSGATININNADDVLIQNFNITNYFEGIRITGSSIKVKVDNGVLSSGKPQTGVGVVVSNGLAGDTYVTDVVSSNSPDNMPLAGIQISQTGHTSLLRNNITSAQYGLHINPGASQDVTYLFCDHTLFDSCASQSLYINPAASNTARARSAVFVNSWFAGTTSGSGITISGDQNVGGSNSPVIDDYRFIGCRVLNNYKQGILISNSGSTGNISFQNCTIAGNSQQSASQWSAVEVDKNVIGGMAFTGNRIGKAGTAGNTQRHAIFVPDSTGSMVIRFNNNNVTSNVIPPYINIGVMTGSVIIADNIGDESTGVSAKSLPISSSATSGATETLLFNYRVPANSVRVGQYYRIRIIGTSSSTGALTFRVRVGANGTVADNQTWISTTSANQTANSRAGFEALLCVRSIGTAGTVYTDGWAHASAVSLGTLVAAPATAAINTTNNWFIDVCATATAGTYTVQVATIDAL